MAARERAVLVLEDGSSFWGWAVGAPGKVAGEVVFSTAMTGCQELLADPALRGAIVTMTYPLVGSTGVSGGAEAPQAGGLVVRELCDVPSHWSARRSLVGFLRDHGVVAVEGIDTRALTRRLRERGSMRGVLATGEADVAQLARDARELADPAGRDLVREVTAGGAYLFAEGPGPRVTVVDCGVTRAALRLFAGRGCTVTVVPAGAGPEEVLATEPDGVVISSGPGDPRSVPYLVETARRLAEARPLFGFGLGHQVIARAFGAETYRLPRGHRGGNYPVRELPSGRVYITAQNHGFAVAEGSWNDPDLVVTHRNVHDGSVEGLAHRRLAVRTVQFRPEASPGPADAAHVVDDFLALLRRPA